MYMCGYPYGPIYICIEVVLFHTLYRMVSVHCMLPVSLGTQR